MNYTSEQLKESILLLAEKFGEKVGYDELFKLNTGFPSIVRQLSYDIVLHQFDKRSCPKSEYFAYLMIYHYMVELNSNGFVEFKQDNVKSEKFEKTFDGAAKFYESIEKYEDRIALKREFELAFGPKEIKYGREAKFYKWLIENKL